MTTFHSKTAFHATRSTVYQLRAEVSHPDGMEIAFSHLTELLLLFAAKSLYTKLPPDAGELRSFEFQDDKRSCECISVPERMLWAIRFKFPSKNKVLWFYDVSLVREAGRLLFGLKIDTVFGMDVKSLQKTLTLPDALLKSGLLVQGRDISANMWSISTPEDVEKLIALLEDRNRTLPVIAVSAVNWKAWRFTPTAPAYLVNAEYLAGKVKGYAIVAKLSFQAAFILSDKVGKGWSVYDGACRTYFPKVDFDNGVPAHHPCNFKEKIWFWSYGGLHGGNAYTAFLIDSVHQASASNRTGWGRLYFVPDARILSAELDMAKASHLANAPERERAMQKHIAALQSKLETAKEENNDWLTELENVSEALEYYRQENANLRLQLDALRAHLRKQTGELSDAAVPIPESYKVMGEWVKEHLAGRLILHPRAERAVAKAEYSDVKAVYRALLILANEYRDSRMGVGTDEAFRKALADNGMDFSGSIDKCRAGQEGEAYYVKYPVGTAKRAFLQYHIVKGTAHEDRFCMRIYFFWDDETGQVVVGWLPSHLSNRIS